jgi:hypothetical protein
MKKMKIKYVLYKGFIFVFRDNSKDIRFNDDKFDSLFAP